MSERSRFYNRRIDDAISAYRYSADDFAEFLSTFFSTGVISGGLRTSSNGTQIVVAAGYAMLAGHWYNNDTAITLSNPLQTNKKRKDCIALKLDKEERYINAVWITGNTDTYPTLTDSNNVKYLRLADVDLLAGGTIKAVYDKRTYSQALYTMSLDEFKSQFNTFLNACSSSYNDVVSQVTALSELLQARGGFDVLTHRLDVADIKHEDITEAATGNIFDCTKITPGWLDQYGGIEKGDVECFTSDFISIAPGTTIYCYDHNGTPVKFENLEFYRNKSASGLIKTVNVQATNCVNDCNASYFRADFEVSIVNAADLQITRSNIPPKTYIPYQVRIKPDVITETQYGMDFIGVKVNMGANVVYSVSKMDIACNAPVIVHITRGGGQSTLVRIDRNVLRDTITGKIIDSTMTDVEITADDLVAGLELTEGGILDVYYYNKNCEDLFSRISDAGAKLVTPVTEVTGLENESQLVAKEEVEI